MKTDESLLTYSSQQKQMHIWYTVYWQVCNRKKYLLFWHLLVSHPLIIITCSPQTWFTRIKISKHKWQVVVVLHTYPDTDSRWSILCLHLLHSRVKTTLLPLKVLTFSSKFSPLNWISVPFLTGLEATESLHWGSDWFDWAVSSLKTPSSEFKSCLLRVKDAPSLQSTCFKLLISALFLSIVSLVDVCGVSLCMPFKLQLLCSISLDKLCTLLPVSFSNVWRLSDGSLFWFLSTSSMSICLLLGGLSQPLSSTCLLIGLRPVAKSGTMVEHDVMLETYLLLICVITTKKG